MLFTAITPDLIINSTYQWAAAITIPIIVVIVCIAFIKAAWEFWLK